MDFPGAYNAILRRLSYIKFMAIPNYTYLNIKMPDPHGVITTSVSFRTTYACEKTRCELASAQAAMESWWS